MGSQRRMAAFLLSALVSCRADRITSATPTVISATDAWSGGTLVLASASFAGADSLPVVVMGAETLAARVAGPDSIRVQLPDTNGLVVLRARLKAGTELVDSVRVHGFVSAGSAPGPAMTGWLYPWPHRGAGTAVAFQGGRLVLVDLGLNTSPPLTPDTGLGHGCLNGPVPSATVPGLIVVSSLVGSGMVGATAVCGPMIALSVGSSSAAPDTGPPPDGTWPAAHLGPGVWLISHKWTSDVVVRLPSGGFDTTVSGIPCYQPAGFAFSPRGDRVVPGRCWSPSGIPVVNPASGAVAYYLTGFRETWAGEFSAGGDTLFQAAEDSAGQNALFVVDPTTGRILSRVPLDELGLDVRVDPNGSWVYVGGAVGGMGAPFVAVFDPRSLARVATLRLPAGVAYPTGGDFEMVSNAQTRRLFLTVNDRAAPVAVYTFELMP